MLGIVLGAEVIVVNQTDKNPCPRGSYILERVRQTLNNISNLLLYSIRR